MRSINPVCLLLLTIWLFHDSTQGQEQLSFLQAWNDKAAGAAAPANNTFQIDIDTVAVNIGELPNVDLTGYSTYRLYLELSDSTDKVSAIYGGVDEPLHIHTSGAFFQSVLGGVTSQGIYPTLWSTFPSNQYDSFITIGIDEPAQSALGQVAVPSWSRAIRPGHRNSILVMAYPEETSTSVTPPVADGTSSPVPPTGCRHRTIGCSALN